MAIYLHANKRYGDNPVLWQTQNVYCYTVLGRGEVEPYIYRYNIFCMDRAKFVVPWGLSTLVMGLVTSELSY